MRPRNHKQVTPTHRMNVPKGHCEIIFKNDTGLGKMAKDTVGLWHHDILSNKSQIKNKHKALADLNCCICLVLIIQYDGLCFKFLFT